MIYTNTEETENDLAQFKIVSDSGVCAIFNAGTFLDFISAVARGKITKLSFNVFFTPSQFQVSPNVTVCQIPWISSQKIQLFSTSVVMWKCHLSAQ